MSEIECDICGAIGSWDCEKGEYLCDKCLWEQEKRDAINDYEQTKEEDRLFGRGI